MIKTAKVKLTARRPKILLKGTITKPATPRVMTVIPVRNASCELLRWNSWPRSGNIGAIDRAPVTEIHVKSHWLAITMTMNMSAFTRILGLITHASISWTNSRDHGDHWRVWESMPSSLCRLYP
jgi:hypothetical protein